MPRTKSDGRKAVGAKAPRKNLGVSSSPSTAGNSMKSPASKKSKYAGGNSICPRPTPEWQKEITNFMIRSPKNASKHKENVDPTNSDEETSEAGCSKEERTVAPQDSDSSSRVEEDREGNQEDQEVEDDDEEEVEAGGSSSTSSSNRQFVKNNCISDDEDDD